jgi:hypothetical protein
VANRSGSGQVAFGSTDEVQPIRNSHRVAGVAQHLLQGGMVPPHLSPGDALAEQARQLAAAHAENHALVQEAQQASELAYRSKVHATLLCGRWSVHRMC